MISTWSFPTKIIFGAGASEQLAELAASLNIKRPLVVTDPGIVKCGLLEQVIESFSTSGIPWKLFDRVEPNPTEASVLPGVEVFAGENCDGVEKVLLRFSPIGEMP